MLKTLRRKFVLYNMLMVGAVLTVVFVALAFSAYHGAGENSKSALRQAVMRDELTSPKFRFDLKRWQRETSAPMFLVVLDDEGSITRVTYANAEENEALAQQAAALALAGGESGTIRELELRYLRIKTPFGQRAAFVSISEDIASLRSQLFILLLGWTGGMAVFFVISLLLSRMIVRPVENAWAQQKRFIADASHELKTPLTVILANLGILRGHEEDTIRAQDKWLQNTQDEAERMKQLVDDLLFLAKADAARPMDIKGEVDLSDIVWGAVLPFESVAFERGQTLQSDIAPDTRVPGDASALRRLAGILLDNACKYTPHGGQIDVTLACRAEDATLCVRNTGAPIPPEQLPHIFERFYRGDASRARTEGGYGLGLSIAYEIAHAHGGHISVKSDEHSGTAFTVTLARRAGAITAGK